MESFVWIWRKLSHHLSFAASQRRVLVLLLALLIGYGTVRLILNPATIDDPQPPAGDRDAELADRLDPNTAPAADLAALPGLGDKRAAEIVTQREKMYARDPATPPFRSPDDLYYVRGFGPSMVEQLRPFLVFPSTQKTGDNEGKVESDEQSAIIAHRFSLFSSAKPADKIRTLP